MKLFGMGALGPDIVSSDDYLLAPDLGLASVATGLGKTLQEARSAVVLATWAITNEAEHGADDRALSRAMKTAEEAISRLSYGWARHVPPPLAMVAAVHLIGSRMRIVHVGRCRVSRIGKERLIALTEDHDEEHERNRVHLHDRMTLDQPVHRPDETRREPTRMLGRAGVPEITEIDVNEGDELLLASASLQDHLNAEVLALLCQTNRPLISRAVDLWHHATRLDKPFAFALVRVVKDEMETPCWTAGSSQPDAKFLPPPGKPFPPLPFAPPRGPDEQWEKEMGTPIAGRSPLPLSPQLRAMVDLCSRDHVVPVLIRAMQWSLRSLLSRGVAPKEPVNALLEALEKTKTLDDWGAAERKIKDDCVEALDDHLGDWASRQATEKLSVALDCLFDWQHFPEQIENGLMEQLGELVSAEGDWDWDELLAEADLAEGGSPNDYWDRVIVRDEQEALARGAFLRILADFAEPAGG